MGFLSFLKSDKRKNVFYHLDEEKIKDNESLKIQAQKIMALEAQLSKVYATEKQKKDREAERDKESEFNKKLNEQKLDLDANRHGKVVRLGKFYYDLLIRRSKHFKNKPIEITDKNDEVVLGKFGDFGIMEGGKLCILDDKGELMAYGKSLNHILHKPDAFENMVKRGRFTIPMDKDGNWMEDIEYKEIPEPIDAEFDEETGLIKRVNWSKVKTSEVKKVIARIMQQTHDYQDELDRSDSVIIKLKQELDDKNRSLKIATNQGDVSQSELSRLLSRFTETEKRMGEFHRQVSNLTEVKATYENLLEKKDAVIDKVLSKLEMTGELKSDRLKEELKDDLQYYKQILPDRVEIKQEAVPVPRETTQPGDVIKR